VKTNRIELSYRKSAVEGASPIGLVIALYDTLSGNLRRAATAILDNNIEKRCAELNHATLVLGQLEDWIDKVNGGDLAQNLSQFYAHLRAKLFEASIKKSAPILETQIGLILQIRGAWQQRDMRSSQESTLPSEDLPGHPAPTFSPMIGRTTFSQSA
jgi:flagellar secretion chaperone FliS